MNGYSTKSASRIISTSGYSIPSASVVYDTDADAYFTAAGITNLTEKSAWNTFVLTLKSNLLWTKAKRLAPVSPTSYGASLWDGKTITAAYSATAAPSFSTPGWTGDGTTQFIKTGFISSAEDTVNNHVVFISQSNSVATTARHGAISSATSAGTYRPLAAGNAEHNSYTSATLYTAANASSIGVYAFGTIAASGADARYTVKDQTTLGTSTAAHGNTLPTHEDYILARNNAATADQFGGTAQTIDFWARFTSLTIVEAKIVTAAIATYKSTIGR